MAIHSPNTGIVDWAQVARSYGKDLRDNEGRIITGFEVRHCNVNYTYKFLFVHYIFFICIKVDKFELIGGK